MINFEELHRIAPEVAEPIGKRFAGSGLGMLGTIRSNGAPRVSPIEVSPFEDRSLFVGMMPNSQKHLDVQRDPRYCMVTALADKGDVAGEGKLYGILDAVTDPDRASAVLRKHAEVNGFDPEALAGSPMFELLIDMAAWQIVIDDAFTTFSWKQGTDGVQRRSRTN